MTRSKPSAEISPAETIGKILERFRLSQGWKSEDDEDHDLRLTAFLEILGAAKIQPELYDQLYRRTIITRARKKANGEDVSYFITPEEMVTEYFILQKEQRKLTEKVEPNCTNGKYHVTPDAQVLSDLFNTGRDEFAPCPVCRITEYAAWRKTQIALYGEVPIKTFLPKTDDKPMGGIFARQPEDLLSTEAGDALAQEHNLIICQITDDEPTQNLEMVVFDEGANVFKHKHRNDKLYSPKDLRKRIERYGQILDGQK